VRTVPTKPLHPSVSYRTSLINCIDTSSPEQQQSRTFRARKMIIVSGGTLSSPLILQRSGIGDPEKLKKVGVKPIVDLLALASTSRIIILLSLSIVPSLVNFTHFIQPTSLYLLADQTPKVSTTLSAVSPKFRKRSSMNGISKSRDHSLRIASKQASRFA
jgi:hypothetical protein